MAKCKAPEILRVASRRIRSDFLPRRQDGEAAGQRSRWTFFSSLPDEKTIFAVIRTRQ